MKLEQIFVITKDNNYFNFFRTKIVEEHFASAELTQISDVLEINDYCVSQNPDLILMDISMLGSKSKLSIESIAKCCCEKLVPLVLLVKSQKEMKEIRLASYRGIDAIVTRDCSSNRLISTFKLVIVHKLKKKHNIELSVEDLLNIDSPFVSHNESLFNLINTSNDGIWFWDIALNQVTLSPKFKNYLGYDDKTLPDSIDQLIDLIHPEDKKKFRFVTREYVKTHIKKFSVEIRLRCSNDQYRWFLFTGFGIWNFDDVAQQILGIITDIDSLKSEIKKFENMALYDSLTELPNRILLYDRLNRAIANTDRNEKKLGLLFIDINKFKAINDTYGHRIGDLVLIETAKRLALSIRKIDTVARLSGDEFVVILPNINTINDIRKVIERIERSFETQMIFESTVLSVSCSIGHSTYPKDGETIDELLVSADKAMYSRKNLLRDITK